MHRFFLGVILVGILVGSAAGQGWSIHIGGGHYWHSHPNWGGYGVYVGGGWSPPVYRYHPRSYVIAPRADLYFGPRARARARWHYGYRW
jgi:hypothetical protein